MVIVQKYGGTSLAGMSRLRAAARRVTGQAAGLAMAMTDDVTALDVSRLQNELVKQGVLLHLQDAGLAEN